MPTQESLDEVAGYASRAQQIRSGTAPAVGTTPLEAAPAATMAAAVAPQDSLLQYTDAVLNRVDNIQHLWEETGAVPPQLDSAQKPDSGVHDPRLDWSGPDDRTVMQKFVLGSARQVAGGLLDIALGIPAAGAQWLTAGAVGAARVLAPDNEAQIIQLGQTVNQFAGTLLRVTDSVAGRPVVRIPDWIPFLGGQDAIRMVASFAPIPYVGGTTAARVATSASKNLAKAIGINLAFSEAKPAVDLALAQTNEEQTEALKEAAGAALASGVMGAAFFGAGYGYEKWKGKLQDASTNLRATVAEQNLKRRQAAISNLEKANVARAESIHENAYYKAAAPTAASTREAVVKGLNAALAKDTLQAGSVIGDADARAAANLKEARENPQAPEVVFPDPDDLRAVPELVPDKPAGPIPLDKIGIGGMDKFMDKNGTAWQFRDWKNKKRTTMQMQEIIEGVPQGPVVDKRLKNLQWIKPTLDPNTPVPAIRLKDGRVIIGEGLNHFSAAAKAHEYGFTDKDIESYGFSWGSEKKYYTRPELVEARSAAADRQKALVEIESAKRIANLSAEAAMAEAGFNENHPKVDVSDDTPTHTTPEQDAAFDAVLDYVKGGGTFHNLPERVKGWRNLPVIKQVMDYLTTPKHYLLPEETDGIVDIHGKSQKLMHDHAEAGEMMNQLALKLFPHAPGREGMNMGAVAQLAAGAGSPANKAKAMAMFSPEQQFFLEKSVPLAFKSLFGERIKAGVLTEKQNVRDFVARFWRVSEDDMVRVFESAWDKTEIGPLRDMHAFSRLFKTLEEGLGKGAIPKFDHIGSVLKAYYVSTGESVAKSIARQEMLQLLSKNDLTSIKKVPGWVKVGSEKNPDPYFAGLYVAPDAAKAIMPLIERPPAFKGLETIDRINHLAKRYGLGLDLYQFVQSVRSMTGTTMNPFSFTKLYKQALQTVETKPDQMRFFAESGLRLGDAPGHIVKDLLAHKERMDYLRARGAKEMFKNPLDATRYLFDSVEEFSIKQAFTVGKVMAMQKELAGFNMDFMKKNGRAATRAEELQFAQKIAPSIDNRFGGLNYTLLGRSAWVRTLSRLTLLAPDWTESRLRLYFNAMGEGKNAVLAPIREAFGDKGAMNRAFAREETQNVRPVIKMFATIGLATEVLNFALNGHTTADNESGNSGYVQLPFTTKFGTHPGINLWGYSEMPLRMMAHMVNLQPEAFYNERRAPALSMALTMLSNQDNFGQPLKGDVPFMRPPTNEREKNSRVMIQKGLQAAGMFIPAGLIDGISAMDRTIQDGALDQVRWMRSVGSFFSIKVSSGYPQEIRQRMQFLEDNESWIKGEYKRLRAQGNYGQAMELRRDWNEGVKDLHRKISTDPVAATVFRKRRKIVDMMAIN